MIVVTDRVRRLASQHRGTGTERLLSGLLSVIQDRLADQGFAIHTQRLPMTASGIWLDYLGLRFGIRRPTTLFPIIDYFGFSPGRHVGFGQGPFFTDRQALQTRLGISDPPFRLMLRARALALVLSPTRENLQQILEVLFGEDKAFITTAPVTSKTLTQSLVATTLRRGRLIGTDASGNRFTVVPGSGQANALPDPLAGSGWTSLVTADDVLYGIRAGQVYSIDWTSTESTVTRIGTATLSNTHTTAQFSTQTYGFSDTSLFTLDLTAPSETAVGAVTGITGAIRGATADASKLYIVTDAGNVYSVNPSTRAATLEFALSTLVSPMPTGLVTMEVINDAFVFFAGNRVIVVDGFIRANGVGVTIWATSRIQDFVNAVNLRRDLLIPRPAGIPLRLVEYLP